jgi:uncharacterized protein (DUF697 family)
MSKNIISRLTESTKRGIVKWSIKPDGSLHSAMGKQFIKLVYGKQSGIVTAEISYGITAAIGKEEAPARYSSRDETDLHLLFHAALKSLAKISN